MQKAQLVDAFCQRWHCPPRQILREDAHELFVMLAVLEMETETETETDAGDAAITGLSAGPVAMPQPALSPVMADLAALSTALT